MRHVFQHFLSILYRLFPTVICRSPATNGFDINRRAGADV
jgi:hypothetical protein